MKIKKPPSSEKIENSLKIELMGSSKKWLETQACFFRLPRILSRKLPTRLVVASNKDVVYSRLPTSKFFGLADVKEMLPLIDPPHLALQITSVGCRKSIRYALTSLACPAHTSSSGSIQVRMPSQADSPRGFSSGSGLNMILVRGVGTFSRTKKAGRT